MLKIKRLGIKNGFTNLFFSFSLTSHSLTCSNMPSSRSHNRHHSVTSHRSCSHNGRSSSSSQPHHSSSQSQGQILPIGINWTIIHGVQVQIPIPLEKTGPMRAPQHRNDGLMSLWIVSWLLKEGREQSK
jgi:hypothetical protein